MNKQLLIIFIPIWLLLGHNLASAQDIQKLPELKSRVTDLTSTLNNQQISSLENKVASYENNKGSQVVILIIATTYPEEIEQYGIRLAEKWKIGRDKIDDGVILIIAKDDRKIRIEVSYGLEGALPDAYAKRIIENVILPDFRQGQFYQGIDNGINAIIGLIEGEELPEVNSNSNNSQSEGEVPPFLTLIVVFVLIFLRSAIKNKGIKMGIIGTIGVGVWIYSGMFFAGIIVSFIATFFMFGSNSGGGGYFGGRGYSSGGGFSSGGGGFSGGGGSFGGGGASGGW